MSIESTVRSQTRRIEPGWVAAATVVLVAVLAAVAVLLTAKQAADLKAESETRSRAAEAIIPVAGALRTAQEAAAGGAATASRLVPVAELASSAIPEQAAVRARDTGVPVVDDTGDGVIVAPVFQGGSVPASVADRRRSILGFRTVPLDLAPTLAQRQPDGGGIAVSGTDRTVASLPGPVPADADPYTVPVSAKTAPGWTLTVWTAPPTIPLTAWVTAALLLAAGAAAAGWLLNRENRAARSRRELQRLREQSMTVAALARVGQDSLDLADVLPAITTQITEALDLRGLTLSSPTPEGDRLFFAWGESPTISDRSAGLPQQVAPGETVSTVLSRGGRTVARLTVVAGRPLDKLDVQTLSSVADTLTSALANAEAFGQQRELLQRMRAVDELKTVFLATASHELRTPVGVITGYARILSNNWDQLSADQGRTYAERVDQNAQRLRSLVEDLLDFSRLERGVGLATSEDSLLDLGEEVGRILERASEITPQHKLSVEAEPGLQVRGSHQALERVVTNLVGNAAKYSPEGTRIFVRARGRKGRAELVVDDEGPGVPLAEREQIFSRFFRGRGDAVINTRGAGLGLAIVSEFAASMGGKVKVAASDSGGARFVVSYPLAESTASEGAAHVAS
jgi:signal transduction histidine kinase